MLTIALFCTFAYGQPFVGTLFDTRLRQRQEASAGVSAINDLEMLIVSGRRLYRVVGQIDDDDEPYRKGEEVKLPEGPCDKKIG